MDSSTGSPISWAGDTPTVTLIAPARLFGQMHPGFSRSRFYGQLSGSVNLASGYFYANTLTAVPVFIPDICLINDLVLDFPTTPSGNLRLGIYSAVDGAPGALLFDGGTQVAASGVNAVSPNLIVGPGTVFLAGLSSATSTVLTNSGTSGLEGCMLPSVLSIGATYIVLRLTQRRALNQEIAAEVDAPRLSTGGKTTAGGIVATAILLMGASAFDLQLGAPTWAAGVAATAAVVLLRERAAPWGVLRDISWGVLLLVAGLFVLVEALAATGVLAALAHALHDMAQRSAEARAWGAGMVLAIVTNLMNNLPAGLIAGRAVHDAGVGHAINGAVLIGVDLGPNLSVTGSLATILWLTALKREGIEVSAWQFLKLGILVMPPALVLALGALLLT